MVSIFIIIIIIIISFFLCFVPSIYYILFRLQSSILYGNRCGDDLHVIRLSYPIQKVKRGLMFDFDSFGNIAQQHPIAYTAGLKCVGPLFRTALHTTHMSRGYICF